MAIDERGLCGVLKAINPLTKGYFCGWVAWQTGYDILQLPGMTPRAANRFLEDFFVCAAIHFGSGAGGIGKIREGVSKFRKKLGSLEDLETPEYHNLSVFLSKLNVQFDQRLTDCEKLVRFLTQFKSFGHKIASLFVKILVKDLEFFGSFCGIPQPMFVPLDKVNTRMCNHLLKGLGRSERISGDKLSNKEEIAKFNRIAEDIMGRQDRIYFENIWFIGHFYHSLGAKDKDNCCINDIQLQAERPVTMNLSLPHECPLGKVGCSQF